MLRPQTDTQRCSIRDAKLRSKAGGRRNHTGENNCALQKATRVSVGGRSVNVSETGARKKIDADGIWSWGVGAYDLGRGGPRPGETAERCICLTDNGNAALSGGLPDVRSNRIHSAKGFAPRTVLNVTRRSTRCSRSSRSQGELETDSSLPQTKASAEYIVSKSKCQKRGALLTSSAAAALVARRLFVSFSLSTGANCQHEKSIAVLH